MVKKILLFSLVFLAGCTIQTLQTVPPSQMPNDQLLRHYYQLNDKIAYWDREAQGCASQSSTSRSLSGSLGESFGRAWNQGLAEREGNELRKERIEVLMELNKRGIKP